MKQIIITALLVFVAGMHIPHFYVLGIKINDK